MINKIIHKFKLLNNQSFTAPESIINKFIDNENFPFLVSFSRTGSHWLRMIMELYFDKPSLVRAFYIKRANDFTCFHTHDLDLSVKRKNVIYLYRNPVETIFSQLSYHKQDTNNELLIKYWANIYGLHLSKWLQEENFTEKKTIITYENMKNDMEKEFEKICIHFGVPFDKIKLASSVECVSKEKLKQKTKHDEQVVNITDKYQNDREIFKKNHSDLVYQCIKNQNANLINYF